jgi:hypothetical protein
MSKDRTLQESFYPLRVRLIGGDRYIAGGSEAIPTNGYANVGQEAVVAKIGNLAGQSVDAKKTKRMTRLGHERNNRPLTAKPESSGTVPSERRVQCRGMTPLI